MRRIALLLAIALITILLPIVSADVHHVTGNSSIGCIDKEEYNQLIKLAEEDTNAYSKKLTHDVKLGAAIVFEKGQIVELVATTNWDKMVQVRPQGDIIKYWTTIDAID